MKTRFATFKFLKMQAVDRYSLQMYLVKRLTFSADIPEKMNAAVPAMSETSELWPFSHFLTYTMSGVCIL